MIQQLKALPAPLQAHVDAVNARDAPAMLNTSADDAIVNDVRREFHGARALVAWIDSDIIALDISVEVIEAFEHDGIVVMRARYGGNFDRAALGLPDEVILTNYVSLLDDRIATMIIIRTAGPEITD